jgi:ATP-dependent Lhr-like helicase
VRTTPIALLNRQALEAWSAPGRGTSSPALTASARKVLDLLQQRGALFFREIAHGTGLLRTQAEEALGELVALGLITADSFTGLRALLVPPDRRKGARPGARRRAGAHFGVEDAGRWSLVSRSLPEPADPGAERVETVARTLLRRYGVVFRRLLDRESGLPPWRDLLRFYHRLEARGEIRGGRFVAGFSGEQFALPEAVGTLRELGKEDAGDELVSVSGADPLNLIGVIAPGARVPALTGNRILFRAGVPLAVHVSGETRILDEMSAETEWDARKALERRAFSPRLRAYLGTRG